MVAIYLDLGQQLRRINNLAVFITDVVCSVTYNVQDCLTRRYLSPQLEISLVHWSIKLRVSAFNAVIITG